MLKIDRSSGGVANAQDGEIFQFRSKDRTVSENHQLSMIRTCLYSLVRVPVRL